jgi:hypothetical protein
MRNLTLELCEYGSSIGILPENETNPRTELDAHIRALYQTSVKRHSSQGQSHLNIDTNLMVEIVLGDMLFIKLSFLGKSRYRS